MSSRSSRFWCAAAVASSVGFEVQQARAASTPKEVQITLECNLLEEGMDPSVFAKTPCGNPSRKDPWIDGRLDWYSGKTLVFQENGPFMVERSDSNNQLLFVTLDGNDDPATFTSVYEDPKSSIFQQPDLNWQLFTVSGKGGLTLTASQPYLPQGSALWAKHSEDTIAVQSQIASGDAATLAAAKAYTDQQVAKEAAARSAADQSLQSNLAAETSARQAADNQLHSSLDAETAARKQGDASTLSSANSYTDSAVANEAAARKQGDASTLSSANSYTDSAVANEAAARKQGDADTLSSANSYTDSAVANEAAARKQGDADAVKSANAYTDSAVANEAAARKQGDADTLSSAKSYTDSAVANEAAARQSSDSALQSAIDNEAAARQQGDANTLSVANAHADQGDASTLATAEAYSDSGNASTRAAILGGNNTYSGNNTYNGTSTWNGAETHNGAEVHKGAASFTGGVTANTVSVGGDLTVGGHVSGNGSGLTNLSGANLTAGSVPNSALANSSINIVAGAGLSGGGTTPLGGSTTVSIASGGVTPVMVAPGTYNISITGNAGTVTNGVYTNGSYADPAFITALAGAKITGTVANAANAVNATNATNAANAQTAVNFTGSLGGDVTGTQGATAVIGLQGRSLSAAAPTNNQVLAWNGMQWAPTAVSSVNGNYVDLTSNQTVSGQKTFTSPVVAPSFVDQNDPSYVLDPNVNTHIRQVLYQDDPSVAAYNILGRSDQILGANNPKGLVQYAGNFTYPGRADGVTAWNTGWYLGSHGSYGLYTNTGMYVSSAVWAPILYDANNTGYYVDPASTSNTNVLRFNTVDCLNGTCPPNNVVRMTPNLHLNAGSGYAVILNWDNGTTGANQTFRIGNGAGADAFYVYADGQAFTTNWWRSIGNTGWYNNTYGVGLYATDSTWIRTYPEDNSHHLYAAGGYDSAGPSGAGCGGGLGGGFNFQVCGSEAADIIYDRNNTSCVLDQNGVSNLYHVHGHLFEAKDNGNGNVFISTAAASGGPGLNDYGGTPYPVLGTTSGALYVSVANQYTGYFDTGGYHQVSDERMKKEIVDLREDDFGKMLDRLTGVRSVRFRYKTESAEKSGLAHVGVIAQSMPPETVSTSPTGVIGIGLADTIGYTIGALRGLNARTMANEAELRFEIQLRDRRIEDLEMRLRRIEERVDPPSLSR